MTAILHKTWRQVNPGAHRARTALAATERRRRRGSPALAFECAGSDASATPPPTKVDRAAKPGGSHWPLSRAHGHHATPDVLRMRAPPSSASRARYANTAQCSSGVLPGKWVRVGSTRSASPSGVREIACDEQRAAPPLSHRECAWQVAMEAECACAGPPPPQFLLPPPPRPPFLRDLTESSCAQSQHPDTCDVVAVLEARWHDDEALLSAVAVAACSLLLVALATAASILLWKYKRKKARAAREGVPEQTRPRPKDSVGLDDEALDADGAAYEDVIQMRLRRAPSNHYTRDHRASRLHQYAEPLQVKATGSRTKLRRDEEEPHSFVCSLSRDGYGHVYQEIGHGLSGGPSYGEPPCLADERVAGLSGEPRPPTPDLCRHWPGGVPPPPPPSLSQDEEPSHEGKKGFLNSESKILPIEKENENPEAWT
ncbi:uncharacterized protein LOC124796042 [Schistocerca piceifrons]|uniref:uncharacterized protein LOC124796042 n=1 Tax=Schistocerca piceifrons TaxID=274613 RepID=UPI001F5F24D2|nr:uncharacterized protein LOC124796042 [Schistocerca piceifrons]